jgi:hypothetical protein
MCSHFTGPGMDGLDTRQSCTNGVAQLNGAGYHAFNDVGTTAYMAMGPGYAQDDAIWALFGHSNAGFMTTYNSVSGQTVLSVVSGMGSPCSSPNACLNNYTFAQLHRIRLMLWGGCYTANSWNGYRLPQVAVNKGVDASIGWSGEVYWPHMDLWTQSFFWYSGNPPTLLAAVSLGFSLAAAFPICCGDLPHTV